MKPYIFLMFYFFLVGCSSNNKEGREQDKDSANDNELISAYESVKKNSSQQFKISNTTAFDARLLLNAEGHKFEDPNSNHYLYIGNTLIRFVVNTKHFYIGDKVLEVKDDTIKILENWNKKEMYITPKSFLNYQYPKKYKGITNEFISKKFGKVNITSNGNSCDDSYRGKFKLEKSNKQLTIDGLANVDVFENLNSEELYIVSYHNCLIPNIKIIRVK